MQVPDSVGGPFRDRTGDRWIKRLPRSLRRYGTSRSYYLVFALIRSGVRHSYATVRAKLAGSTAASRIVALSSIALLALGCGDIEPPDRWRLACQPEGGAGLGLTFERDLPQTGERACAGQTDFIARNTNGSGTLFRFRQTADCCQRATCDFPVGADPFESCGAPTWSADFARVESGASSTVPEAPCYELVGGVVPEHCRIFVDRLGRIRGVSLAEIPRADPSIAWTHTVEDDPNTEVVEIPEAPAKPVTADFYKARPIGCNVDVLLAAAKRLVNHDDSRAPNWPENSVCLVDCGSGSSCDSNCGCSGTSSYYECKAEQAKGREEAQRLANEQRERDLQVIRDCEAAR